MRRTALLATVFLASPLALVAQSHPMVGEWKLSMVVGARVENGTQTPINGTATLTVNAVGDSLVATMLIDPVDGQPQRPASRMTALDTSGDVVFVLRSTATVNINGESHEATGVSTYTFKVNGDRLDGTVTRSIEGIEGIELPPQPPQPVTGVKTKS